MNFRNQELPWREHDAFAAFELGHHQRENELI